MEINKIRVGTEFTAVSGVVWRVIAVNEGHIIAISDNCRAIDGIRFATATFDIDALAFCQEIVK